MWWRILVAVVLTLPPVVYLAGALASDVEHQDPHPTVVLPTSETDRGDRGDGPDREAKGRDREDGEDRGDNPRGVTVVRPGPMAVGDDGGDDDQDDAAGDGDHSDDRTDDETDDD